MVQFNLTTVPRPCASGPAPSRGVGVITVAVVLAFALIQAFLKLFVAFLSFATFTKNCAKELVVLLLEAVLACWPLSKPFLSLPSLPYLQQSIVLWVACMPTCFLHNKQCFTSLRGSFGMGLFYSTILHLLDCRGLLLPSYWAVLASSRRPSSSFWGHGGSHKCTAVPYLSRAFIWPAKSRGTYKECGPQDQHFWWTQPSF